MCKFHNIKQTFVKWDNCEKIVLRFALHGKHSYRSSQRIITTRSSLIRRHNRQGTLHMNIKTICLKNFCLLYKMHLVRCDILLGLWNSCYQHEPKLNSVYKFRWWIRLLRFWYFRRRNVQCTNVQFVQTTHKNTFGFLYNLPPPSIFFLWCFDPIPGHYLQLRGFAITPIWQTTLSMNPLDKWSARRRDLYLTTHNTHMTSMSPLGIDPTIPATQHPEYRAFTGISSTAGKGTFPPEIRVRYNFGKFYIVVANKRLGN